MCISVGSLAISVPVSALLCTLSDKSVGALWSVWVAVPKCISPQQASVIGGAGSFRAFRLPSPSWSWMHHLRPAPPRSKPQRKLLAQRG